MTALAFVHDFQAAVRAGFTLVGVVTAEEGRARELLAIACKGMPVVYWSPSSGTPAGDALAAAVAAAAKEVHVLADAQSIIGEPSVQRSLREIGIGQKRALVVLLGSTLDLPQDLAREMAFVELALPTREELAHLLDDWQGYEIDRDAFVRAAAGLTLTEAARAFRLARGETDAETGLRAIIARKRSELRRAATLEIIDANVPLEDVGGLTVLKSWLASRVQAYGEDARAFGLPEPRGMLVCGVQGCGKSHVSKAAASVLKLPLVRLDFAAVFSSRSPEQALRDGLRAVTAIAPLVLWVDEIEKGLAPDGRDAAQTRVFGAFLTWLQERTAPVFVAATANEVDRLPPELARRGRFDEVFFVDLPAASEREEILALTLRRRGRSAEGLDLASLAQPLAHFSGAELEQVVIGGLFRAFGAKRELTDEDLRISAREIIPLATLYEEKVQRIREWGRTRARRASADRRMMELFE